MEISKYVNVAFWIITISMIVWYSYTWAVIGWMIAHFQGHSSDTTDLQAILKIITCLVICVVYFWMFYLVLILRRRYKGIGQLYQTTTNTKVTRVTVKS